MRLWQNLGAAALLAAAFLIYQAPGAAADAVLDSITLPPGFFITYFAPPGSVRNARSLAVSEANDGRAGAPLVVYVSTNAIGSVYAVVDFDGDGFSDSVHRVVLSMGRPNGIVWREGALYIAQIDKVWKVTGADQYALSGDWFPESAFELIYDDLPQDSAHGWKFIRFSPSGHLFVPIGAPCNKCDPGPPYSTLLRMNADGTGVETWASGIRNTVGFDFHPDTEELWFTDNGRDGMGDNAPDDELNRAHVKGMDFGYPACNCGPAGGQDDNPFLRPAGPGSAEYLVSDDGTDCSATEMCKQPLGPHVAALGMRFYTGSMFPESFNRTVLIAQHGSWDRSERIGYRVMQAVLNAAGTDVVGYNSFAEGWLPEDGGKSSGRPVDVHQLPDGSVLVSDDVYDCVYRITYGGDAAPTRAPNSTFTSGAAAKVGRAAWGLAAATAAGMAAAILFF